MKPQTISVMVMGSAIMVIEAAFVYGAVTEGAFQGLTLVEGTVLVLAAIKGVGFFAVRALREETPSGTVAAMTAELFFYQGLAVLYLVSGDQIIQGAATQVFLSWLLGTAVFALPFLTFKTLKAISRGGPMKFTLPGLVLILELQQGFLGAESGRVIFPGPLGFGSSLVQLGRVENGFAIAQVQGVVLLALVAFFLAAIMHLALFTNSRFRYGTTGPLLLLLAGTLAALVWAAGGYSLVNNLSLILAPPAVFMSIAWWLLARGR